MSKARTLADYVGGGSTAAEFDVLDGLTVTTAELNHVDGLTSTAVGINDTQTLTNKTLTSVALENASATQNLSGTYSTERLFFNDSYTLTGDVNVTGHLALGSVADSDIVITQDSTERTITGSGLLESGRLMNDFQSSLTGMTGELGSVVTGSPAITGFGTVTSGTLGSGVTGSPNLNLSNATFPAGHVIYFDVIKFTSTAAEADPGTAWVDTSLSITVPSATVAKCSKIFIVVSNIMVVDPDSYSNCSSRILRSSPSESEISTLNRVGDNDNLHTFSNMSFSGTDISLSTGDHVYKVQYGKGVLNDSYAGNISYHGNSGNITSITAMGIK